MTSRLRLKPAQPVDADDLWRVHNDPGVARWNAGTWSDAAARARAAEWARAWRVDGAHK